MLFCFQLISDVVFVLQSTSPITLDPNCLSGITKETRVRKEQSKSPAKVREHLSTQQATMVDVNREAGGGSARQCCHRRTNPQPKSNMAAPRLTMCQVPPCSNPSFETFVATRANGHEGKAMSVVDILHDIKCSETNNKFVMEERRGTSLPKPVVCPKV